MYRYGQVKRIKFNSRKSRSWCAVGHADNCRNLKICISYRFLLQYVCDDKYDVSGIVKGIKDQECYEAFFMSEIAAMLEYHDTDLTLTDLIKSRCIECARTLVVRLCNGKNVYYGKVALDYLLKGYFEIDSALLPCLLKYAYVRTTKKDDDGFYCRDYSLFDYISEHAEPDVLAPFVIDILQKNIDNEGFRLSYDFANYLVVNHIEAGYSLSLHFALSGFYKALDILETLIKEGVKIDEIKAASKGMNESDRVFCLVSLARNGRESDWAKSQLESEFRYYCGYALQRALMLLLSVGSMEALDYLSAHPDLLREGDDFRFNYDNPNAVPSLCYFIVYCDENKLDDHFTLNSILFSLEKIATKCEDALIEVKSYLRQVTQKGRQFMYLNRYIISFEDKYYAANKGIGDIHTAMVLVDFDESYSTDTNKTSVSLWGKDEGIYISYNWESHSSHIVDYLCMVLEYRGIPYLRDKKDCNYHDNIKSFMDSIRNGKLVIVVLSRPYMKSKNCMYELSGILQDSSFKERILPVVVDDTIRDDQFYLELVRYWNSEKKKQENFVKQLQNVDPEMAEPAETKLNEICDVNKLLKVIKDFVDWVNADNLDALCSSRFGCIIKKIMQKSGK